jgi:predicted transcriptional regulator
MLSGQDISKLVRMRGLGLSQTEIGREPRITQGAVSYNISKLRVQAGREGLKKAYIRVMASGGHLDTLKSPGLL